jgi:hypothetical protein
MIPSKESSLCARLIQGRVITLSSCLLITLWIFVALKTKLTAQQTWVDKERSLMDACNNIQFAKNVSVIKLKDTLLLPVGSDDNGKPSDYVSLYNLVRKLADIKALPGLRSKSAPVAVNFGARDGMGDENGQHGTWRLFKDLDLQGLAVESLEKYATDLGSNFQDFRAKPVIAAITQDTAVSMIRSSGLIKVDILEASMHAGNCDIIEALLSQKDMQTKLVLLEYNTNFPPPIQMRHMPDADGNFKHDISLQLRGCSLQYANDKVMQPAGFVLAQVDRDHALYVSGNLSTQLGIPATGIDVHAAYVHGYTERRHELVQTKDASQKDIEAALQEHTHGGVMQRLLHYVRYSRHHTHEGKVSIGCGDVEVKIAYKPCKRSQVISKLYGC